MIFQSKLLIYQRVTTDQSLIRSVIFFCSPFNYRIYGRFVGLNIFKTMNHMNFECVLLEFRSLFPCFLDHRVGCLLKKSPPSHSSGNCWEACWFPMTWVESMDWFKGNFTRKPHWNSQGLQRFFRGNHGEPRPTVGQVLLEGSASWRSIWFHENWGD